MQNGHGQVQSPFHNQAQEGVASSSSSSTEETGVENAAAILSVTSKTLLNHKHSASRTGIPLGAIVTPLPDLRAPLPVIRRLPVACGACCAVINSYCKVDSRTGRWTCVFCGNESSDQGLLGSKRQGCAELRSQAIDYVTPPPEGTESPPATVALLLDATAETSSLEALKAAALQVLSKLPRRTRLLLISFGAAVSVYHLGEADPDRASADVFPGHQIGSPETLRVLLDSARTGGCISPLHTCKPAAEAAVQALRPMSETLQASERPRCIGAAIHAALYLFEELSDQPGLGPDELPQQQGMSRRGHGAGSCRVLVITTGPITRGPGSVPISSLDGSGSQGIASASEQAGVFCSGLAATALDSGTAIDILAVGMAAVNIPLLSKVATDTGGMLHMHQGMASFQKLDSVGFGLLFAANAAALLNRRVGIHGVLDFHASRGLEATQLVGSVAALDRGPRGLAARGASGFVHGSGAVELNVIERGQAVGICLDVSEPLKQTHAYFQAVVSWTAEDGCSVHRIVTRRLDVTTSRTAAMRGTDCEVAALLLSKRIVQQARQCGAASSRPAAEKLRTAIGKHLAHVASAVGEQVVVPGSWFAKRKLWLMPPELRFLNEALYQLQRGPMLGSSGGHPDEQALLHALFINAAPAVALRMLAPALHLLDRASGQFTPVMPANIALWSDSAAILDQGNSMAIWLGREVAAAMPDPSGDGRWTRTTLVCERHATRLAAGRFPMPEVITATEGAGSARHVAARLIPMHCDSPEEQETQVPFLALLNEEQLAGLLAKQPPTDEASLLQWTRAVGVVPSLPQDNVTEALEGMAMARSNSIGLAGLRRAQSLAEKRRHSLAASKGQAAARSMSVAANDSKVSLDKGRTEDV